MKGGDGNDKLAGGEGNDLLVGGLGADKVDGQEGADRIFGNAGRDQLSGGPGEDFADGGSDQDECSAENARSCQPGIDFSVPSPTNSPPPIPGSVKFLLILDVAPFETLGVGDRGGLQGLAAGVE